MGEELGEVQAPSHQGQSSYHPDDYRRENRGGSVARTVVVVAAAAVIAVAAELVILRYFVRMVHLPKESCLAVQFVGTHDDGSATKIK